MASVTAGVIAAGIGAAGSLGSAAIQSGAATSASNKLNPFTQAGTSAVDNLVANLGFGPGPGGGAFRPSPGYQWAKSQGIDAIQNSAAGRGGVVSGNTLKALDTFGTGLADQNYQQFIDNLLNLARLGANAGGAQGNFITQAGNAQGAGVVGSTNALTSMLPFLLNSGGGGGGGSPILSNGTLLATNTAGNPIGDQTGLSFIGQVG